jgi:indole-3-acetate monooxygenase
MTRSAEEALAAVDAVASTVREAAEEAERDARAPDHVIDALHEHRLFRLWIPEAYGGDELPLPAALAVFEAAGRLDGSIGWLVTIGVGGGLFAAQLEPAAAREIFEPADSLIAGSGAPTGRADVTRGGYRVTGYWRYASGAPHATWFTANTLVSQRGTPPPAPKRGTAMRAMAFPANAVEVQPTWSVSGMRATASHDFRVDRCFVPEAHSFAVGGTPLVSGALYRFPFASIAELSFASVALGIARRALDEFAMLGSTHRLAESATLLRTRPAAHDAFARAEAAVRAARAWCFEVADSSWAAVAAGRRLSSNALRDIRLASLHATGSAADAADLLYEASGIAPLFMSSPLGRCVRDLHALTQNAAVSPARRSEVGRELLAAAARSYRTT